MGKKEEKPVRLTHGSVVTLAGGRLAQWESVAEEGTRYRTEHFRCVDSLGLLLKNGAITQAMHDAGEAFNRNFVFAQLHPVGAAPLDRIPGSHWTDSMTERVAWARKRIWHVAGLGCSVKEWSSLEGWNGRTLNQYEAKGILVGALGVLAVYYGYSR
ncbi:MAG: hypothetical protein EBU75_03835 [Betaproteobacteria bacterium]|nr:hypothetical protein [Betaproteobacteria bacterium]